jgi:hypothetical protein
MSGSDSLSRCVVALPECQLLSPTNIRFSADEYVAVITCAQSQPETRSGHEAGRVHEGVLGSPPSNRDRPTTSPQAQPARPRITR